MIVRQIEGVCGRLILLDYRLPENAKGLCVFMHGFKGFKDWGLFNEVADFFAEHGLAFLKFNFSHNGTSVDHPVDFVDLEAFGNNCYSYELLDLFKVLDWVETQELFNHLPIHLIGHSRGAGIALLGAAQDDRIRSVISWASVSDFYDRFIEDLEGWKRKGVIYTMNGRTKQEMPLYYSFYEDYIKHKEVLDIPEWMPKLAKPTLLIHGTEDKAVLIDEVHKLKQMNPKAEMLIIEDADHTFGVKHPPIEPQFTDHLNEVVWASLKFIKASN